MAKFWKHVNLSHFRNCKKLSNLSITLISHMILIHSRNKNYNLRYSLFYIDTTPNFLFLYGNTLCFLEFAVIFKLSFNLQLPLQFYLKTSLQKVVKHKPSIETGFGYFLKVRFFFAAFLSFL